MRPDRAGVILLAGRFVWRGLVVDVAAPVGDGQKPEALEWLQSYATTSRRPLLYRIGEQWLAFGPADFRTEMRERVERGEEPWA